ncbi:MAG: PBP1A family penicillin-binding protein [Endomicrobiales bacterium]|nr:PBP1A family penicillin-binding protein [Endomicrobiales bacterium]
MKPILKTITNKKLLFVIASLLLIFGLAEYMRYLIKDLPSIHTLEDYTPSLVTRLYDINGELITEFYIERRTLLPLKDIPVDLQNAVLAIEDDKFFEHWGISFRGIFRAALNNIRRRRVSQGGSTITQQLAKIIFLTPERTLTRKLKELLLTLQLEYYFTKAEILQLYLNQIYFGGGAYGVKAAAKTYFDKEVKDLNLAECALLAGLPRAPNYYSPFNNKRRAFMRRATVIKRMRELNFITDEEERQAHLHPLITERIPKPPPVAPYFAEYVRILLEQKYGSNMIYQGGLSVYTTLDIEMQKAAEETLDRYLTMFDEERPKHLLEDEEFERYEIEQSTPVKVQCGLIAMDPKSGEIRAMVGGRDFQESQFNRAYQARRQPGSVFKPFIYTTAIENGFTPATIINDSPLVYINDGIDWRLTSRTTYFIDTLPKEWVEDPMKVWVPANYKNKYNGEVTLRKALERSMNMCSIQILDQVRPNLVIKYAEKMGIESPLTNTLSLALGASDVTLMEITRAVGVIANSGIRVEPYAIIRIEDNKGRIIEENFPQEKEVLSPQTCYVMTNLLQGVVQHGTGQAAKWLRRPCAGKTGTTNDYTDAWFVGFTPQLITGVWVGYDDIAISLGEKMSGGRVAAPIWTDFMYKSLKDKPVLNFKPPEGIVFTLIDPKTGLLALSKTPGAYLEAFIKGTEPTEYYYQKKEFEEQSEYEKYLVNQEQNYDGGDEKIEVITLPPMTKDSIGGMKIAGEKPLIAPPTFYMVNESTASEKNRISIEFLEENEPQNGQGTGVRE